MRRDRSYKACMARRRVLQVLDKAVASCRSEGGRAVLRKAKQKFYIFPCD